MRYGIAILFAVLLLGSFRVEGIGVTAGGSASAGDSIMRLVVANAIKYRNILKSYEADVYIKGRMQILKRNYLIRFAHNLFPVNRRESDMVFEMISLSRFEFPNAFYHDYKAINGSSIPNRQKQREILRFLDLNIYGSTAFDGAILMPTAKDAAKYYDYRLDTLALAAGDKDFVIHFQPKHISQKLISGTLHIVDSVWTVARISMTGRYYFSDFQLVMTFGRDFDHFNLPETADLSLHYDMLGNSVSNTYHSHYNYRSVAKGWDLLSLNVQGKPSLNLSQYYGISSDTVPIISDPSYWENFRDKPLSREENNLYLEAAKQKRAVLATDTVPADNNPYLSLAELMVNDINAGYKNTYIRYYGILNPSQIGYSQSNGITYRQRLRVRKVFRNQTQLSFIPDAGFASRRKEIFLKGIGIWEYKPERMAALTVSVGNGNQSYSAGMMKDIGKQLADSSFTVDDLNLQYFHHYYGEIKNQIELFNGFQLTTTAAYNHRRPVKHKFDIAVGDAVKQIINNDYNDFTTTIGFSYTPHYYYRIDRHRKEYLFSRYPTISVEFAKAIPGVAKGTGNYGRVEADVHQSVPVGLLQKLNYHVSAGLYTSKKSSYFTDFRYFARRNFPDTWDDRIGGVFNLLEREWFYASDQYVQAHLMYESPFILLPFFEKAATKYVFAERIYFSQLWTPALPSYTEVGYGIGNHIFDIALFAGFAKLGYRGIGLKFAFELFR